MPLRVQLTALNVVLASALICGAFGAVSAQQDAASGGAVLPGPSLDDAPAPAPSAPPAAVPAPSSQPPSAPAANSAPASTAAPAPHAAPDAAPAPRTSADTTPGVPAASPPASRRAPAPVVEQSAVDEPWYERMWGSVTGWFSGIGSSSSSARTTPQPAAPAAVTPRSSAPMKAREGFAADTPERTVRTGMGDCLKTGTWNPEHGGSECPSEAASADARTAAAAAAAVPPAPQKAQPEPVEVKPLAESASRDARPLEPEAMPSTAVQPATPMPAPAPPPAHETMTLSADALFSLGSFELKPSARKGLDELAQRLGQVSYDNVKVTGHSDPSGSAAANDRLSQRRADAVKRYLVSRGVAGSKIEAEGVGSRNPVVAQSDCAALPKAKKAACYQPDRRVEIEVIGASSRTASK